MLIAFSGSKIVNQSHYIRNHLSKFDPTMKALSLLSWYCEIYLESLIILAKTGKSHNLTWNQTGWWSYTGRLKTRKYKAKQILKQILKAEIHVLLSYLSCKVID